jgi:hypothetical protein
MVGQRSCCPRNGAWRRSTVAVFALLRGPPGAGPAGPALADERGGDEETRTPDPLLAKEMLFQLSYVPTPAHACQDLCGGRFWTRTRDLCLIRAVL